jgi:hypothetical protein
METIKHWRKKVKRTLEDKKIPAVHGSAELIL